MNNDLYIEGYYVNDSENVGIKYEEPSKLALKNINNCTIIPWYDLSLQNFLRLDTNDLKFMKDDTFEAIIRFSPEVSTYISNSKWCKSQSIEYDEDNYLKIKVTIENINECISWVLSFGSNMEILEPEWLKQKVLEQIDCMKGNYNN